MIDRTSLATMAESFIECVKAADLLLPLPGGREDAMHDAAKIATAYLEAVATVLTLKTSLEDADAKLTLALALTDTGSEAFRQAFPPRSVGESLKPRETVPGWRVVEKIREALL